MPSERMRLEAEMKDSASPAIKKLRAELATLQDTTRETRAIAKLNAEIARTRKETGGVHVSPGMRELPKWLTNSTEAMGGFVARGTNASSVINGLGIGGLTAAASLAGVVAQMKAIGERSLAMKELGRETGMTVDQVNAFAHAGQHFGVGADAMNGALDHLASQMPEFRRNYGAMFQELSRWPDLIKKLQGEGTEDQIKDIFKFLGQEKLQKEPQLQKQILGALFGSGSDMEKLFAQGADGFLNELAKQKQQLGSISPEMLKQAQDFRDAQIKFNDTLEKFETTIGPAFLSGMTSIVSSITSAFDLVGLLNDKLHGRQSKLENEKAGEENRKNFQLRPGNPYADGKLRLLPQSYRSGGGMLHLTSFGDAASGASMGGGMVDTLAAGTKQGFLAAFRELMATGDTAGAAGGGLINASYGGSSPGGLGAGTGGRDVGGGLGSRNRGPVPDGSSGGSLEDTGPDGVMGGPGFNTRGVRNKNIGNIGYGAWAKAHGAIGAAGTDTGHGVAVFPSFAAGAAAAGALALEKYNGGKRTIDALIAGQHGWTPGNHAAAANIARSMGLSAFADAHLDSSEMMEKFKHGLAAQELGPNGAKYAFQRMGAGVGAGLGSGGKPVDLARSLLGTGEAGAAHALGHYMHSGEWCADFVNGALAKTGGRGTGSAMAASFFKWGRHVGAGDTKSGDVLVSGHHVGFATGPAQMRNGRMMYPMVSGNYGHRVANGWADARQYEARRAEGLSGQGPATAAGGSRHHLDVEIHDRGGSVVGTSMRSRGHGMSVDHRLTRWPTREQVTST